MVANTCKFDLVREGGDSVLRVDCEKCTYCPSVEDSALCMSSTIDKLATTGIVTRMIFSKKRDYEYDYSQVVILSEVAKFYKGLIDRKDSFSYFAISGGAESRDASAFFGELSSIIFNLLKADPVGAYVELKRILRRERIALDKHPDERVVKIIENYIRILVWLVKEMDKLKIVEAARPFIAGFKVGDREVYRQIFKPSIRPDFMFTKLMADYPPDAEELSSYTVGKDTEISVFEMPGSVQYLYHMTPPEFKLSEEKYEILDQARKIMAEHKPTREEFVDPQRMREVFFNVGRDLIDDLCTYRKIKLAGKEKDQLTNILIRYTVGFGLIEVLLQDENIQDISVNSPLGRVPLFIVHGEFADCTTNIIPTMEESESWASKLRLISGRPLDEANPVLDTELILPGASTRVAAMTEPLNPSGIAFSFRRHRDRPWTLPLFMKYRSINALGAGLWSFLIDGSRTMLVAGTRSSGKSSLLTSVLVEIMRRYRVITVEDTLELPVGSLRDMGYNIQPMKVATFGREGAEMSAADGIRTTLRLGDSALIVGEVRSKEAIALYEAMRIGAAANVVAGTIHGESPYGLFDRVVNDIGVPKTSFKATDLIVVTNPIKSPDGLHRWRRIVSMTEVRKDWTDDPLTENGFVDLMKYNSKKDELEPTGDLINGDSDIMKSVAANVKEWAGNWDAVWDNVLLRAKIKQALVDASDKRKDSEMLEAPFVIKSNDMFHHASDEVLEEVGGLDTKMIYDRWESWLVRECKKRGVR
jgi:type IV secretory pathway ATPase VirB11/archaellum biosynthesis ATPase